MRRDFLQVSGENFVRNGEKVFLRGFAIGSWMNLEHFMMGMPGTDEMMKEAFTEVYGAENSRRTSSRHANTLSAEKRDAG